MSDPFFRVTNEVTELYKICGNSGAVLVYAILCRYANGNRKFECWPSVKCLATDTGLSERQVLRMVALLESKGIIAVVREVRKNTYTIVWGRIGDTQSVIGSAKVTQSHPISDSRSVDNCHTVTQQVTGSHSDKESGKTFIKKNHEEERMRSKMNDENAKRAKAREDLMVYEQLNKARKAVRGEG